jgi:hypothetical protein
MLRLSSPLAAHRRRSAWLVATALTLGCGPAATAEPQVSADAVAVEPGDVGDSWVRILRDKDDKSLAMQTAIVRYVPADDFVAGKPLADYRRYVDLVGAVHVADRSYYEQLNERFSHYDAVLYELVAAKGTKVARGRGTSNRHALGAIQNGMKSILELEHQLEQVDYTRPNFVHADMSPDEFFKTMDDRDETFLEMYFRIVGASLAQQSQQAANGENPEFELMAALLSEDRARRLKILLAKQFQGMESMMLAFNGTDGSTIITERNKRALAVLKEQLDDGQERLAIFYGAGHLSDMHDRLINEFHMRPVSIEWLDAWDLRAK